VEGLLERRPRELSGGQRQRVAVGRAIVRQPKAFLFDEPLSNLDAKLRVQTRAQLTRLHQRLATTFIYVTHDQVEAMTMASRIAVMKDGLLQQIDTPQHLYDHPNNVFVAGFIGSPSMNFFDATLTESDGKLEINAGGFRLLVPDEKAKDWRQFKGREIIFGIRPEDIHAKQFVPPGIMEADVASHIEVTELMGNEIFLYMVTRDNKQFIARVDPRVTAHAGDDLDLALNMNNAHIFDPKTEVSLAG
jgi:multiple sugar transport system ATP-binding protein